jgi:hypothetical protein
LNASMVTSSKGPVPGCSLVAVNASGVAGTIILTLPTSSSTTTSAPFPYSFPILALGVGVRLHFRALCSNYGGVVGPAVPTAPGSLQLQPPLITAVEVPGGVIPTAGGMSIVVRGVQIGAGASLVRLHMVKGRAPQPLTSQPCTIVIPTIAVSCAAPVGTGADYSVVIEVDGILSPPWAGGFLSYAPPVVQAIEVVRHAGGGGGGGDAVVGSTESGSPTQGGETVVLRGSNFGMVGGGTLDQVQYASMSLPQWRFIAKCDVTRDHVQLKCTMVRLRAWFVCVVVLSNCLGG